jgi:DNA-binding FadR family transcriptional regulator
MSDRYAEIVAVVRERICSGVYRSGARVPSQSEMADEFDAPHRLIGFVIAELREKGYVRTIPHKGSYVQPSERWPDTGHDSGTGSEAASG